MKPKLALLVILVLLVACVSTSKNWSEMSPKEKATIFLTMYNSQYDDYLDMAARPDLSEEQKTILRAKRQALKEIYPIIDMYAQWARTGTPSTLGVTMIQLEQQILSLLNALSMEVVK